MGKADETKTKDEVPRWIRDRVLPVTEERVRSLHLMKEKGMRRSALLFTEGRAYLAEKGLLTGVRMYEIDYPRGLLLNGSACPHCGKMIREPVRKVATAAGNGEGKAARRPPAARAKADAPRPEAGLPVDEIEGIGGTYLQRLKKAGIATTADLVAAGPERVAKASKAPRKTVEKWVAMAHLMTVKGIGKQFAELLMRSEITSVEALSRQKPKDLLKRVKRTMAEVDVTIQGAPLNTGRVGEWIREAKKAAR